jgi:nucleotide-binding universal stress UspA family protein
VRRTQPALILVGIDFSEGARRAAAWAVALADGVGADLVLCHVMVPVDSLVPAGELPALAELLGEAEFDRLSVRRIDEARRRLRADARRLGALDAQLDVHFGSPAEGLVDQARRYGADLLVVGSAGLSSEGLERVGSVAERVVRSAASSVVVVKPRA